MRKKRSGRTLRTTTHLRDCPEGCAAVLRIMGQTPHALGCSSCSIRHPAPATWMFTGTIRIGESQSNSGWYEARGTVDP